METESDVEKTREVYERAIANVPPTAEARAAVGLKLSN